MKCHQLLIKKKKNNGVHCKLNLIVVVCADQRNLKVKYLKLLSSTLGYVQVQGVVLNCMKSWKIMRNHTARLAGNLYLYRTLSCWIIALQGRDKERYVKGIVECTESF